jgi:hypothetical protein
MTSKDCSILWRAASWAIALVAVVFSVCMIAQSVPHVLAVFSLADPSGAFGVGFYVLGLLANVCVVFLFMAMLRRRIGAGLAVAYAVIFGLKFLEAMLLLPCLVSKPGALCGVGAVTFAYFTSPFVVLGAAILVATSGDATVRGAGLFAGILLVALGAGAWWQITPKSSGECNRISEVSGRGACLEKFAIRERDMNTCRRIEFRPMKYECMRNVAAAIGRPDLCEEIRDPVGAVIPSYETPDVQTRSLCFYVLALDLRNRDLCLKIEANDKRQICLTSLPDNGRRSHR